MNPYQPKDGEKDVPKRWNEATLIDSLSMRLKPLHNACWTLSALTLLSTLTHMNAHSNSHAELVECGLRHETSERSTFHQFVMMLGTNSMVMSSVACECSGSVSAKMATISSI